MAENGNRKINLEDFIWKITYFKQNSTMPEGDDCPFTLDYKTETCEGQANP